MNADQAIRTEINFVDGFDAQCLVPKIVQSAELKCRFAVIHETYRPDSVDMYFDEALWRRLFEFAVQYAGGSEITAEEEDGGEEESADVWTARWNRLDPVSRKPTCLIVRQVGSVVLCIAPEFWTMVGGPMPYADSYTYSIFSDEDLGERVIAFLRTAPASGGWEIADHVMKPEYVPRWKLWLRAFLAWL